MNENILGNIAVLIDSDNSQATKMEDVLKEISLYGHISVKRAYGNWRKDGLSPWNEVMISCAIKAVQQFDYVKKKNATDLALTIDAMDLLHSGTYDGFALVSSDSDFTPLAIRIRESGAFVIGVGNETTPDSLKNACDIFLKLDSIGAKTELSSAVKQAEKAETTKDSSTLLNLIRQAWEKYQDESGYAFLSGTGGFIKRAVPDFDIKEYGYKNLETCLASHTDLFGTQIQESGGARIIKYTCL